MVALQALATLAALSQSHDIDLTVRVDTDEAASVAVFYIDHSNYMLHQSRQVRPSARPPNEAIYLKLASFSFRLKRRRSSTSR